MIIKSLLDTDFYKFTMMQVVLHQYPAVPVRYAFKWRNWDKMKLRISVEDFAGRVKKELDKLCELKFTSEELDYMESIPFFKYDFIEFLRLYKLHREHVKVYIENGELKIAIFGPWLHTILFEIPVLAIVSQLYTENCAECPSEWLSEGRRRLVDKFHMLDDTNALAGFSMADFGTRRRASIEHQRSVIDFIVNGPYAKYFTGTSNVLLAKEFNIKPIGTMAHEFLQAHQQTGVRLVDSQSSALQAWANEYRGELGIALSDVLGFDVFLKDFDRYFALLFDGCRHDSGNPIIWADRLIKHYEELRIDPRTKSAVFSDGLNFENAIELFLRFHDRIKTSFGIGTYLTNDCGFTAPQIVLKMVFCNHRPVAKISDSIGKGMCEDTEFLSYLKKIIREKIEERSIQRV